jgi:hypothetical protein
MKSQLLCPDYKCDDPGCESLADFQNLGTCQAMDGRGTGYHFIIQMGSCDEVDIAYNSDGSKCFPTKLIISFNFYLQKN